jgi:hypothetical protein
MRDALLCSNHQSRSWSTAAATQHADCCAASGVSQPRSSLAS